MALRPFVLAQGPTRAISSPLARATDTAALLGFDSPDLDGRWQEADLGNWTGTSAAELKSTAPDDYTAWRSGTFTPPGGESFEAMTSRVVEAVAELDGAETLLVVTHGGPIRALCRHFVGLEPRSIVPVDPASITVLDFTDVPRLKSYGIALNGLSADPPD